MNSFENNPTTGFSILNFDLKGLPSWDILCPWFQEIIGDRRVNWYIYPRSIGTTLSMPPRVDIYFKTEEDKVKFILRWL